MTHAVRDAGGLASHGAGASSPMESTSVEEWLRPMLSAAACHQSQPTERCSSHARRDTSLTTLKLSAEFSSSRDAQFQMEAPTPGNNELAMMIDNNDSYINGLNNIEKKKQKFTPSK